MKFRGATCCRCCDGGECLKSHESKLERILVPFDAPYRKVHSLLPAKLEAIAVDLSDGIGRIADQDVGTLRGAGICETAANGKPLRLIGFTVFNTGSKLVFKS